MSSGNLVYFREIIPKAKQTNLVSVFVKGVAGTLSKEDYVLYADCKVLSFYMRGGGLHICVEALNDKNE